MNALHLTHDVYMILYLFDIQRITKIKLYASCIKENALNDRKTKLKGKKK